MVPELSPTQLASVLSLYHLDGPQSSRALSGLERSYLVHVSGRDLVVRLVHKRSLRDMVFERDVLEAAQRAGLGVARIVRNVAQGSFTPWSNRGRYVSIFEYPPGRAPGRFELTPAHAAQLGQWLGHFHRGVDGATRCERRLEPLSLRSMQALRRLERGLERRRLARRHQDTVERLQQLHLQLDPEHGLPGGPIHDNLELWTARVRGSELSGVVGFSRCGVGPWLRDLARALNEWCWRPTPQDDPLMGSFDPTLVDAMVQAYHGARPLEPRERHRLLQMMMWVALDEATRRLTNELRGRRRSYDVYRDPRHPLSRLFELERGVLEIPAAPAKNLNARRFVPKSL